MHTIRVRSVAALLFFSGMAGLALQVAWLRELRLVFGSSTLATSAVLAIFMGGLGFGSVVLGRYADRVQHPLRLYGMLELAIALFAFISPFLLYFSRSIYIALGGSITLGQPLALLVRLIFSAAILGIPTFLMGGTLPAAVRAVETRNDVRRCNLATLYGCNTLGGVIGVFLASFYSLEHLGIRMTLWSACLIGGCAGLGALILARRKRIPDAALEVSTELIEDRPSNANIGQEKTSTGKPLTSFVFSASFLVGFAFMFMELVWYRMLVPLLGGSTYTLGLILAVALLGIGSGGILYGLTKHSRTVTLRLFAVTCGLEAFFLIFPFAIGDHLAALTVLLGVFNAFGMTGQVITWLIVTLIVVFPASLISGFQFPLLVGLLGQGKTRIGTHTGLVYGWNTLGSIAGALAGGMYIMPYLSAPTSWQLLTVLLIILAVCTTILSAKREHWHQSLLIPSVTACTAILLCFTDGPSAFWRHSGIGVQRINITGLDRNDLKRTSNFYNRIHNWDGEGIEAGLGISSYNGLSLIINGKSDASAKGDAPTQVMFPLVSAILHPAPEKAMVIGLGTGSSGGWLAEIPSIKQVDIVEIEPLTLEMARRCAPVNQNVLDNPKVNMIFGDGRELLLTTKEQYDLIVSEPSNPYRSGISSLYTQEFYRSVAGRLTDGGLFSQWVQGYEIDAQTVRTIYATLASVFPVVETWQSDFGDLFFICSEKEKKYSVPELRQKVQKEPFRSALLNTWGAVDLEGLLARFVGRSSMARAIYNEEIHDTGLNTDDLMHVEFGFARTVGKTEFSPILDILDYAESRQENRPDVENGPINWDDVHKNFLMIFVMSGQPIPRDPRIIKNNQFFASAYNAFIDENFSAVYQIWQSGKWKLKYPLELLILGEAMAEVKDPTLLQLNQGVMTYWPDSSQALLARYYWRNNDKENAFTALENALHGFRENPWNHEAIIQHTLNLAKEMGLHDPQGLGKKIFHLLIEPFSVNIMLEHQNVALLEIAEKIGPQYGVEALERLEPNIPWTEPVLRYRVNCYRETGNSLLKKAEKDLRSFLKNEPEPFVK